MRNIVLMLALASILTACGGEFKPNVIIDASKVNDKKKYNSEVKECTDLAMQIDLSSETAMAALGSAAVGGTAVAGVAAVTFGAVFAPALPFIAAGTVIGGTAAGVGMSSKEGRQRSRIYGLCMRDRGYRVYFPNG